MRVTVTSCGACPFFKRSIFAVVAGGKQAGDCYCPSMTSAGEVTLARSLPVEDNRVIPRWCPLRIDTVTIAIDRGSA